jgi:phosphate transport system substrate-binding protein
MKFAERLLLFVVLPVVLFTIAGCQGERRETPTKGSLIVLAAETVRPLLTKELNDFQSLYPEAHITIRYVSDREALSQMYNIDSLTTVVISRPLNAEEKDIAKKVKLDINAYKIAIDGLLVCTNPSNPVKQIRTTQIDSICRGLITNWKALGGQPGLIRVCLPSRNMGDFDVLQTIVLHGQKFAPAEAVASSSEEMLRFVAVQPGAIGFVGMNRLAEMKDSVKVLEIADPSAPDSLRGGEYFYPYQAHLYDHFYPLTRDITIYSKADGYGVAAGFITFICNAEGQKIVLNSGLVPAMMPVRLVELSNKGITQ